ncbi:MAG: hypothetical protein U0441_30800 [Polyangiaceae bacterium]
MGLLSWFFPSDAENLEKARALMKAGKHEKARKILAHVSAPEAEKLYDECSAVIDKAEAKFYKKQLADVGFHGFKIEVSSKNPKRKKEIETLVAEEMEKAGVDLGLPDIDEKKVRAALARAQKRASRGATNDVPAVRIVPVVDKSKLPKQ